MKFLIFLSEAMVPLMIFYIVGFGLLSGRPVLDDFIDGAKDGMKTVAGILPTGGTSGVGGSPQGIRVSGFSGRAAADARGSSAHTAPNRTCGPGASGIQLSRHRLVLDIFKEYGTDSSLGLIASVLMSSTETVLYCLSVYFGSVGITRTRYTLAGDDCHGGGSGGQRGAGGCGQIKLRPAVAGV